MSHHQFEIYKSFRVIEAKQENKTHPSSQKEEKSSSYYRTYSRAAGNFAFPADLVRPMKKNVRNAYTSDTTENHDPSDFTASQLVSAMYKTTIQELVTRLIEKREDYLKTNLKLYSPKYARILENLSKNIGTSLIYSQFRNLEGIHLFSLVLETNGYAELKLEKQQKKWKIVFSNENTKRFITFGTDTLKNNVLLKIFNSEDIKDDVVNPEVLGSSNLHGENVKILLVTQSGSEGISLKNVRQVHIMEPYWNYIRIEQVIGRAVRAKSHLSLPLEERQVDVYYYISQIPLDYENMDGFNEELSSDEHIYYIAFNKKNIANSLMKLLKETSVDCHLNKQIECYYK
jgi:hypothetical protein